MARVTATAIVLAVAVVAVVLALPRGNSGAPRREMGGEGAEQAEGAELARGREEALDQARQAGKLGLVQPLAVHAAPGWRGERLWHPRADDWEPAVAGRPGSSRVYMLTTRYGGKPACRDCPDPAIILRASHDGGAHWLRDRYLCRCRGSKAQYDPQIEVAANGSLYAAWLDGFTPGVTFARSDDGGRTWTKQIHVDRGLAWSDKPIVAVSGDGSDVYIAFNGPSAGDSWVAVSHDGGDHFGPPVLAQRDRRYHFAGGGVVTGDGTVAFGETSYRQQSNGGVRIIATTSTDGGQSWRNVKADKVAKQPDCVSKGCPADFYGPQAAMAGDSTGRLLLLYNGAPRRNGRQRIWARTSQDGGLDWGSRRRLSPPGADAAFPAATAGGAGDFRVSYMRDRHGGGRRWNVWYRTTADGGAQWSPGVRISDAVQGPAYVKPRGFLSPYGDYGEMAIVGDGATFAAWGEGFSYFGPGGTWFNRTG